MPNWIAFFELVAYMAFSDLYHQLQQTIQSKYDLRQHILNDGLEVAELNGKCIIMKRHRSNKNIIHIMAEIIPITQVESHAVNSRVGKHAASSHQFKSNAVSVAENFGSSTSVIDGGKLSASNGAGSLLQFPKKMTAFSSVFCDVQENASTSASDIDGEKNSASDGAGLLKPFAEEMTASSSVFSDVQTNASTHASVIEAENFATSDGASALPLQSIAENAGDNKKNNALERFVAEILVSQSRILVS